MTTQTNTLPDWAKNHSESAQAEILAFQSKANSALSRARSLEAKAQNEARDLTDDELAFCDRQMDAFANFQNEIEGFKPAGRKTAPTAISTFDNKGLRITENAPAVARIGGRGKTYADMFGNAGDTAGFKNFDSYLRAVANGDLRQMQNAMRSDTGAAGGWMVPPGFSAALLNQSLEGEIVRGLATVIPALAPEVDFPVWDLGDRSTSIHGFEGQWLGEGATGTDQTGKMRNVHLKAHKLAVFCKASSELAEDGYDFDQQIGPALTRGLGFNLDAAFLRGSGAGQPLGVIAAPCTIAVGKISGQTAGTILGANILEMYSRMHAAGHATAVWVCHPSTLPMIMSVNIATASTEHLAPSFVLSRENDQITLMGKPLLVSEKVPALGTAAGNTGCLMYCDFTQYLVMIRRDVTIEKSNAPNWQTDEQSYRAIIRVDGQPAWDKAATPRNGSATLSPFVSFNPV